MDWFTFLDRRLFRLFSNTYLEGEYDFSHITNDENFDYELTDEDYNSNYSSYLNDVDEQLDFVSDELLNNGRVTQYTSEKP